LRASIQIAQSRSNARTTGVQDVNEAAGKAAQLKLQELDEDAAAAPWDVGGQCYLALTRVRKLQSMTMSILSSELQLSEKERFPENMR